MPTHAVFIRASEIEDKVNKGQYAIFKWFDGTNEDAEAFALELSGDYPGVNIETWTATDDGQLTDHISTTFATSSYAERRR